MNQIIQELRIKLNPIGKISRFFVEHGQMTILLGILITVLGIFSYSTLPKESLPEIVFPSITVSTLYLGASPEDVEALVTIPLEEALSKLEDVDSVESTSGEGLSLITVTFIEGVDMDRKKLELDNVARGVSLPENALEPNSFIFKTSEIPLLSLSLTGNDLDQLTSVSEAVADQVSTINGVDSVETFGGLIRNVTITTDQATLLQYGLSMSSLSNALEQNDVQFPLGDVTEGNVRYNLRIDERIDTLDSIRNTPVTTATGEILFIKDVAAVSYAYDEVNTINRTYTESGQFGDSVFINVLRENNSDVIKTSALIKEKVEDLKGNIIPSNIGVAISRDTANQVQEDLDSILGNALSGLIVVTLVLFLFIGFRESLIVAITIPLTLLATISTLSFFGISLNAFAILGLIVALGLLVDNTIIVMENMDRLKRKGASFVDAAIYGTNQVGYPITAATMTTVAAFFPLAILPGIIGAFINTIPRTIMMTLVLSLVIAIVITPSVYTMVNRAFKEEVKENRGLMKVLAFVTKIVVVGGLSMVAFYGEEVSLIVPIGATLFFVTMVIVKDHVLKGSLEDTLILKKYESLIENIVQSRLKMSLIFLLALGLLVSSTFLIISGQLKIAFFPETEPSSITIDMTLPSGLTLDKMSEIVSQVEDKLIVSEYVKQFNTTIGGNTYNEASIAVDLLPSDISGFDQMEAIRSEVDQIPGAKIIVEGVAQGGPPVGKAIEIQFVGDNLSDLKATTEDFAQILRDFPGVINVEQTTSDGGIKQVINIDAAKANTYGMTPIYIAAQLRGLTEGVEANTIKEGDRILDVRIQLDAKKDSDVMALYIQAPTGQVIPLSAIASMEEVQGVSSIIRENQKRTITLSADLKQGYNASETLTAFRASVDRYPIPSSVSVVYEGEAAGIADSFTDLFKSMILAVFLVFMILTIQFGSVKQPLIILTTVPMALIGVLYGLTITGNEFGFYAFMALVSLVGIAVNDAIVLIDYMNYLRQEGTPFYKAIAQAGRTRFNPVLATTMTTIGGILPLSFKNAYYSQFGYALIFGLLVTTWMTLLLIPIGYAMFEGKAIRKEEKQLKRQQKHAYQS